MSCAPSQCFWQWYETKEGYDVWRCEHCGDTVSQPIDCTGGR